MFAQILVIVFCALVNNATSTRNTDLIMPPEPFDIDGILDSIAEKSRFELHDGEFEGDMLFPKGFDPRSPNKAKGVAAMELRPWPNGTVPYEIAVTISSTHRNIILNAMQTLMYDVATPIPGLTSRQPCVSFRPREEEDTSYLKISYGDGCSSTVGYHLNYESKMKLSNPECFISGIIQHELMHVLGFFHEHSRPDRDSYVAVIFRNIVPSMLFNFEKLRWGVTALNLNTFYDYESIMHLPSSAFSVDYRPTIIPKRSNVVLGGRKQLSATDIVEVRRYYDCE